MGLWEFTRRSMVAALCGALAVAILAVIWFGKSFFLLLFGGLLVAVFLRGLAEALARRTPLPERGALAVVIVALLGAGAAMGSWMGPNLAQQVDVFMDRVPEALDSLERALSRWEWGQRLVERGGLGLSGSGASVISSVGGIFSKTVGVLGSIVVVLFVGLYVAFEPDPYRRGFLALFPPRYRERAGDVLAETTHTLKRWIIGKTLSMLIVGILTGIGLAVLGVPLVLTLAVIAMLLTFIPNLGPIIATVPAALIAFMQEPVLALWVVVLYAAVQTVESYLITPFIQRRAVSVPPALLISAQVLAALLFGFLGLFLATPAVAALLVIVRRVYVEGMEE